MKKLEDSYLMYKIIHRPAMFGAHNVDDVYFFSFGYYTGTSEFDNFTFKFDEYIKKRYNNPIYRKYRWNRIISFSSDDDESQAMKLLRLHFENYVKEQYGESFYKELQEY